MSEIFGGVNFVAERFPRKEKKVSLISILLVVPIRIVVFKEGAVSCQLFGIDLGGKLLYFLVVILGNTVGRIIGKSHSVM